MRYLIILFFLFSCTEDERSRRSRIAESERIEQMKELIELQNEFNRIKQLDVERQRQDINKSLNEMLSTKFDRVQLVYLRAKITDYKMQLKVLRDSISTLKIENNTLKHQDPIYFNTFKKRRLEHF